VLRVVRVHAAQEAEVIRHGGEVWHQIGNHHPALSARTNRGHGLEREELLRADLRNFFAQRGIDLLAVLAGDELLRIEQIHLRRPALHKGR